MAVESHDRGVELIRAAFERACQSGNSEWRSMTAAVLKNRLLDLTERRFDESNWGAESFTGFLAQFGDVVELDLGSHPPEVRLLGADRADATSPSSMRRPLPELGPRRRIRADLWDAVLDYSGVRYVWDGQRAVPVNEGSAVSSTELLPSLTREEFKQWRTEFVQRQCEGNPALAPRLNDWLEREQPLAALPAPLRISWVVELKGRVLKRLDSWFEGRGEPLPPAAIVGDESSSPGPEADDSALRERVLDAVRTMSREELETLQLPARVLLREKR